VAGDKRTKHERASLYDFRFKAPLARALEWYSRAWLERDVRVELERMHEHFSKTAGR
jgi:hypothetical protein